MYIEEGYKCGYIALHLDNLFPLPHRGHAKDNCGRNEPVTSVTLELKGQGQLPGPVSQ